MKPKALLIFGAALLLCSLTVTESARPAEVKIGGLFPTIKEFDGSSYPIDGGGKRRQLAFLLAIDAVNDKTDGRYDGILPETVVKYTVRDSKRSTGHATVGASSLVNEGKVDFVIGAASSGPSGEVQKVRWAPADPADQR